MEVSAVVALLLVDLTVGHADHGHDEHIVEDLVQHAAVADPDPPGVALADELLDRLLDDERLTAALLQCARAPLCRAT